MNCLDTFAANEATPMTPTAPTPKTAIPPVEALSNPPIASNAVSSGISSMLTLFVFGFVLFPNGEEELLLCLLTPKEEEEEDDEAHLFDVEATAILAALRNTMMTFLFLLSFLSFEAERGTLLV